MKHTALWIVTSVLIWWTANTVTSIASKRFMECKPSYRCDNNSSSLTEALKDLRWIDMSFIQLAASALFTLIWLKVCRSENNASVSKDTNDRPRSLLLASFVHIFGILATNASYAAINSSTTQMIKALEPVFTCGILFFRKDQKNDNLSCSALFSLLVMSAGTCLFVAVDSSFNTWGILAAHLSVLAFSIRNVFLNNLNSESLESHLKQHYCLSLYGLLIVLPMSIIKIFLTKRTQFFPVRDPLSSAGSHVISNLASIDLLQAISPSSHAMLDLFKRIFVIIPNILYFSTPMHGLSVTGFSVFAIGLFLFYITSSKLSLVMGGSGFQKWRARIARVGVFLFILSFIVSLMFSTITSEKLKRLSKHKVLNLLRVSNPSLVAEQQQLIISPWAYSRPLPEEVLQNIETWNNTFSRSPVHVFCGSFKCVSTFSDGKHHKTTASFLTISDLVENTIFESWFHKHPLNKVLGGVNFEDHLQQVVLLALAWRKGGTYIDPRVKIQDKHPAFENTKPWIAFSPGSKTRNILGLFNFPTELSFIRTIGQAFLNQYEKEVDDMASWPMNFIFQDIILKTCKENVDLCPKIMYLDNKHLLISDTSKFESNFGILSYDSKVRADGHANLDNEILGFPGLQFVPFVNEFLDRDQLHHWKEGRNVTCFFNAWWGTPFAEWPPAENIDPIMLSMQIGEGMKHVISKNIEYLRKRSPIGCRDATCIEFLKKQGVDAFFSGCLTLLMNPTKRIKRSENIYFVDVNDEIKKLLPPDIQKKGTVLEHMMKGTNRYNKFARAKAAYNLIENYSKAKLVITQRIQSALLCVATGTPVIFIISPKMAGKGDSKRESSPLTQGFNKLFYTVDLYKNTSIEAKTLLYKFNWRDPRPSPSPSLLKRLRATSWNVIRQKKGLYEAALKFGVIPFPNLMSSEGTKQDLFHLIFTTNNKNSVTLLDGRNKISGGFNWKHWRCVESIFYHHPFAKVIMYSNSLPQDTFDVLKDSGYDIQVKRYTMKGMLSDTPAESFMNEKYAKGLKSPYWYAHEADLLRYTVLYKFGGCYLDTDAIFVRSIRELPVNVVGYQDSEIAIGVMYFEKHHLLYEKCLDNFAKNYDPNSWSGNGPGLITRVLHSKELSGSNVTKLGRRAFYMFHYTKVIDQCFQQTSGKTFEENLKVYKQEAFNVHLFGKVTGGQGLNDKLKEGTICKDLLNSFCVLCNNLH